MGRARRRIGQVLNPGRLDGPRGQIKFGGGFVNWDFELKLDRIHPRDDGMLPLPFKEGAANRGGLILRKSV